MDKKNGKEGSFETMGELRIELELRSGSPPLGDASSSARIGGTRLPMSSRTSHRCNRIVRRRSRASLYRQLV